MSTRRIVILVATAAVSGLAIGAVGASWYWAQFNGHWLSSAALSTTQADLIERVSVLEQIRAGRPQDATRLLEERMDGDLVAAAGLARGGHALDTTARQAIVRELQARQRTGYAPVDPQVRAAVDQALRSLALAGPRQAPPR